MVLKILAVVAGLTVIFVIVVALQPNTFLISRSTTISVPSGAVNRWGL